MEEYPARTRSTPLQPLIDYDNSQVTMIGNDNDAMKRLQGESEPSNDLIEKYHVTHRKKMVLVALFSMGLFMDVIGFSVFFILVGPTAQDLGIVVEEQTWVITSYGVTFAAFLLFWGRVSDLYSPKPVFVYGFIGLGITNLILSFLTEPYSFYIIRALSGICGACLVPSSYRLIVALFEKEDLSFAFSVYGISGTLANSSGLVLGGAILMIPGSGQLMNWRWHFRIVAALILPAAAISHFVIPKPTGQAAGTHSKIKRMDLVGVVLILIATLLLILSLTLGASKGFNRPTFYVPFVISLISYPTFLLWERRLPTEYALIPSHTWRYPNFTLWVVLGLVTYTYWAAEYVPHAEIYIQVHHEKPIIASVRLLPQGIIAFIASIILIKYTNISLHPRKAIPIGMIFGIVGYVFFVLGGARPGKYYWQYTFVGSLIGSFTFQFVFNTINVGAMIAAPPSEAGVAGAIIQTSFQVGSIVGLSIQAGLLTVYPGSYHDLRNTRISWYFMLGWLGLSLILFLVFYRRPRRQATDMPVVGH